MAEKRCLAKNNAYKVKQLWRMSEIASPKPEMSFLIEVKIKLFWDFLTFIVSKKITSKKLEHFWKKYIPLWWAPQRYGHYQICLFVISHVFSLDYPLTWSILTVKGCNSVGFQTVLVLIDLFLFWVGQPATSNLSNHDGSRHVLFLHFAIWWKNSPIPRLFPAIKAGPCPFIPNSKSQFYPDWFYPKILSG